MKIKGVIHVHSKYSYDGKESLTSLRDFLLSQGVQFCCLTEHTDKMTIDQARLFVQECKALSGSQFLFIPGFEVPYGNAHILLVGCEVFLAQFANAEVLTTWSSKSALTILAHPVRNRFKVDATIESVIDGIEIWNQQYEGKYVPRVRSCHLFSKLSLTHPNLLAMGGLDFHRREHFGAPIYTLELEHFSQEMVLRAFKNGEYIFGNDSVQVHAFGSFTGKGKFVHIVVSSLSVTIIVLGKNINALLARFGIRLPKAFTKFIRLKV